MTESGATTSPVLTESGTTSMARGRFMARASAEEKASMF
jgi:hypothetical protein